MTASDNIDNQRRRLLRSGATLGLAAAWPPLLTAAPETLALRTIPGHDQQMPALGMGSWITFSVGRNERARAERLEVLRNFFAAGGRLIDSSPMYGSSEATIGWCLQRHRPESLFAATKVWDVGRSQGIAQMRRSLKHWGLERIELMQVHNLVDWRTHLETLRAWRDEGLVRYVGVTTSHGRRHDELAEIIRTRDDVDFVQLTYNLADREAERTLLPLAADHGKAVICNRPFRRRALIDAVAAHPLPEWAAEIDCNTWPQYLLKFIVSHPAVSCAIPATSRAEHMVENMHACRGAMPDAALRRRMAEHFAAL